MQNEVGDIGRSRGPLEIELVHADDQQCGLEAMSPEVFAIQKEFGNDPTREPEIKTPMPLDRFFRQERCGRASKNQAIIVAKSWKSPIHLSQAFVEDVVHPRDDIPAEVP